MSAVGGNKSHLVSKLQVPAWVKAKRRKRRRMQEDYSLHVLRTISNKILPTRLSRWEDLHMRTCPGSLFIVVYQGKIYNILDCQIKNKDEDGFMLGGRRFVVRLLKRSFFRSKVSPIHLVHFLQNVSADCIWLQTIAKILVTWRCLREKDSNSYLGQVHLQSRVIKEQCIWFFWASELFIGFNSLQWYLVCPIFTTGNKVLIWCCSGSLCCVSPCTKVCELYVISLHNWTPILEW